MTDKIDQLVQETLQELNDMGVEGTPLANKEETALFGDGGALDSIGLVNLITIIEEKVEEKFEKEISLINDDIDYEQGGPFKNVANLKAYLGNILQ